jgi:hypothetical protein
MRKSVFFIAITVCVMSSCVKRRRSVSVKKITTYSLPVSSRAASRRSKLVRIDTVPTAAASSTAQMLSVRLVKLVIIVLLVNQQNDDCDKGFDSEPELSNSECVLRTTYADKKKSKADDVTLS